MAGRNCAASAEALTCGGYPCSNIVPQNAGVLSGAAV
jgi:hypothetical protein